MPVGSADSRYAKGTVALTVSIYRIHAVVRSFCQVTDYAPGAYPANGVPAARTVQVQPVKADKSYLTELRERRDKEGEREGATLREGRD